MKVTVRDIEILRAVQPTQVLAYLRARGWREDRRIGEKGVYWTSHAQSAELLVPLEPSLKDFTLRMGDVVETLAAIEQRSALELLRDLSTTSADAVRIRVNPVSVPGGTIPLELGVSLVRRTWDLLAASASAAVRPRAAFQSRRSTQASDYLRRVLLGQTESGSFALTVLSPVPPEIRDWQASRP